MKNADLSTLLLELVASAADSPPREHSRNMIALLQKVVPFDAAWWGWSNFSSSKVIVVNSETFQLPPNFESAFHDVSEGDPFVHYGRDLRVFALSMETAKARVSEEFRAFLNAFDISDILNGHCQLQGNSDFNFFMSLYRKGRQHAFSANDTADFRMLLQHLEQSLSLSLRAEMRVTAPENGDVALVSSSGALVRTTGHFEERLKHEIKSRKEQKALMRKLARSETVWPGSTYLFSSKRYAPELSLIQVTPTNQLTVLSNKERLVADLLSAGMTMREIAQERHLALNTIRNQVASIYKKLGVTNKIGFMKAIQR